MKYTCKCCNFESSLKNDYTRHLTTKKHITNFKDNKYCDFCHKEYSSVKTFRFHYKQKHQHVNTINIININKQENNKQENNQANISYNKIKEIVDESNYEMKEDVKEEIKEEINKSNKEVVKVVNLAINKASSLIKYLMEHHQNTPPLRKIKQKDSINLLRIDYKCPLDKNADPYALEKIFIRDYNNDMFVKNISKSILNLVNHKNPDKQPIWNTDCTRYNYVIKTTMDKWSEDKSGIKFTDYVIKPLLEYIIDLINIYKENVIDKVNVKKLHSEEIRDHYTHLNLIYNLERDILRDKLIKDILKELSPHLRYLESELEELEELEKLNENNHNDDNDNDNKLEELEELKIIQNDLIKICRNNNSYSDNSDSNFNSDSEDNSIESISVYKLKNGKTLTIKH